jgi:ATP-dependent protease ClpP protease subunit
MAQPGLLVMLSATIVNYDDEHSARLIISHGALTAHERANTPQRARAADLLAEMSWATWGGAPGHIIIRGLIDQDIERDARRAIAYAQGRVEELSIGIDSPGGCVPATNRILDDIIALGLPVRAQVFGCAGSAAASLLLAGATRVGTPSSELFLHRTHTRNVLAGADAAELRRVAEQLELDDARYRRELSALPLPPHMIRAATSSRGLALDGRSAFAHRILTNLEPDYG